MDITEPMTDLERKAWREATDALARLKALHEERTGHTVWLQRRHWDIGLRCFSGCDVV